jgi:hypothetical protein
MGELEILITQGFVLWVVLAGFAMIIRGPRGASAVLRWPVVTAARLLRRAIGGTFIALGNFIRGR